MCGCCAVVPADSHGDALLTGKQLSWIWVSARGCFCCPWEWGAEQRESEQTGRGLCLHPGQT